MTYSESHVVTLARSVAHLSSEMRSQQAMVQEMEHIRYECSLSLILWILVSFRGFFNLMSGIYILLRVYCLIFVQFIRFKGWG